jgi:hypothetical protein
MNNPGCSDCDLQRAGNCRRWLLVCIHNADPRALTRIHLRPLGRGFLTGKIKREDLPGRSYGSLVVAIISMIRCFQRLISAAA